MKVDYDKMYATQANAHFDWVERTCLWKARHLREMIGDEPANSILEIGTGHGDALNALDQFTLRIGADISDEALAQHRQKYSSHQLVKIDADAPLPFADNEVDFVLLCDILEHVDNPVKLLREAGRVGENVLLKIPIEKALLTALMRKVRCVEYGQNHPSGHLHCWRLNEALRMIDEASLMIVRGKFVNTPIELIEKKNFVKTLIFLFTATVDIFTRQKFVTRRLIGGSYFAIARKKHQQR